MIRPLRRLHRGAWTILALGLPAGLGLALAARVPPAVMPALPGPLAAAALPAGAPSLDRADLWTGAAVRTRIWADGAVALDPAAPLRLADPLLYWTAAPVAPGAPLPAEAWLLGAVSDAPGQAFTLPAAARGGALVLFSLAHGRVGAVAPLPREVR